MIKISKKKKKKGKIKITTLENYWQLQWVMEQIYRLNLNKKINPNLKKNQLLLVKGKGGIIQTQTKTRVHQSYQNNPVVGCQRKIKGFHHL